MSDKKYLVQRRQTWYVQIRVPDSLYPFIEKRKITRSLKTRDLKEARARRWPAVAELKNYLEEVRKTASLHSASDNPERMIQEAKQYRKEIDLGLWGEKNEAVEQFVFGIEMEADAYLKPTGKNAKGVKIDPETGYRLDQDKGLTRAFTVARDILRNGNQAKFLFSEALKAHLSELEDWGRVPSTIYSRERRLKAFKAWKGGNFWVTEVSKSDAGRYVTEVLMPAGKSLKTVKDEASDLKAFFSWCEKRGYTDINPFKNIIHSIKESSRGTQEAKQRLRRPWSIDELTKLLGGISEKKGVDDYLWPLSVIALFSGMRGEEICAMTTKEVALDDKTPHFKVVEGKTQSSVRDVPIHPLLEPMVKHLVETSDEGYLISGLKKAGKDSKRYHNVSKRFGYFTRKTLKLTDKRTVFHSFRHNMITALRQTRLPGSTPLTRTLQKRGTMCQRSVHVQAKKV